MILWKQQSNLEVLTVVLKGYFCSDVVFNLSNKVSSDTKSMSWVLGFTPTPSFINESDPKRFRGFYQKNEV